MLKQILTLGKALNKAEQQKISGGFGEGRCRLGNGTYGVLDDCGDCIDPKKPYFPSC